MTPGEREQLKDQVRAVAAGRGDGIDLDTPRHWVVNGLHEADPFFDALPRLLPPDANLYFEGSSIAPEVEAFYEAHRARNAVSVVRDTIFPIPAMFHVSLSPEFLAGFRALIAKHAQAQPELFDHVKGYHLETLLFTFHDAFDGQLRISEKVPAESVRAFCARQGVTPQKEETKPRDTKSLHSFLALLEDPDAFRKIRIAGEPWWRRWLRKMGL